MPGRVRHALAAFFFTALLPGALLPAAVTAAGPSAPILVFSAANCPNCVEAETFLNALQDRHPGVRVGTYEIWGHPEHVELLLKLCRTFGFETFSTPAIFLGDQVWFGFSPAAARQIERAVEECAAVPCRDPMERLTAQPQDDPRGERRFNVPLLGPLSADDLSLPALTLILGLLDSFNPCAFFVLLFLLGLLLHVHSRGRMLLVGGTFVLFSGGIYFLFMAAWLNLFLLVGELRTITFLAGCVAFSAGAINVKDFFFFRRGISLSIPEGAKPHLFDRMRRLVRTSRLPAVLAGTMILAVAANSYEILCTAGFPMIFTRVLTLRDLPPLHYYGYLVLYNIVYILPLLGIVLFFTFTLGGRKLTEYQGRILKLVSGTMMLLLGGVLLVSPGRLNSPFAAVFLLSAALLWSALIVLLHRRGERRPPEGPKAP